MTTAVAPPRVPVLRSPRVLPRGRILFVLLAALLLSLPYVAGSGARSPSAPVPGAHHPPSVAALHPLISGPCVSADCGRWARSVVTSPGPPIAPSPATLGSTATNWLVANWSGEGMIGENPSNPANLVAGGLYQYASAMNDTAAYYASGVSGAFTSWDGGRTWSDQTLPSSPDWFNTNSAECNHLHLADTALAFAPNNTVIYVDLSDSLGNVAGCTAPQAGFGLYATVSHDGGRSWDTPVAIRGTVAGAFVDKPWIADDLVSGEAYVVYTDDGNGSGIYLQNSTDLGAHWSPPVQLTSNGRTGLGAEVVVDPNGAVDATWIDINTGAIYFVRSTDHGASFSAPRLVATAPSVFTSPYPDSFRAYTLPSLGVDGFGGNAYTGDLFVTFQNGSGGVAGSPTVSLARSTDNGSHWSTPIRVSSDRNPEDFQPSVAVGPDGTVYVDWYAENAVSGHYRLAGAMSHNGGLSFDRQFNVSDTDSYPYSAASGLDWWIGDYTHIIADSEGARPLWTDARSTLGWTVPTASIWGYVYNITFYTALMVNASLAASVPVTIWANGSLPSTGQVALNVTPVAADWLAGGDYSLTAPLSASVGSSTYSFAYWYGNASGVPLVYNTSRTLNGTVRGTERLVACYAPTLGGTCQAPGAPGFLNVTASPTSANLTLNGVPIASGSRWVLSPGTYWVNASAPAYYPLNSSFLVTPGNTTLAVISLTPVTGTLLVRATPSNALVELDNAPMAALPNGTYAATLPPGIYRVDVSAPRYYPFSDAAVAITSGVVTFLNVTLIGIPGWINGTVDPIFAAVTANGVAVSVAGDGSFSTRLSPGRYWINATLAGWTPVSSGPVDLGPLGAVGVSLRLWQYNGTVAGTAVPANASINLNGVPLTLTSGAFRIDVVPGQYTLNASAWSYDPISLPVSVTINQTTPLYVALNLSSGWIDGSVLPVTATATIDGTPVSTDAAGSFNVTAPAGTHRVQVTADGYLTLVRNVTVHAGRATSTVLTLAAAPGAGAASTDVTLLVVTGLVVAIAAIAIVLLVLRRRRRRPYRR